LDPIGTYCCCGTYVPQRGVGGPRRARRRTCPAVAWMTTMTEAMTMQRPVYWSKRQSAPSGSARHDGILVAARGLQTGHSPPREDMNGLIAYRHERRRRPTTTLFIADLELAFPSSCSSQASVWYRHEPLGFVLLARTSHSICRISSSSRSRGPYLSAIGPIALRGASLLPLVASA
jgi:hypothetical protein